MLEEEVARMRVQEAIQKGLAAQERGRQLGRRKRFASAKMLATVRLLVSTMFGGC